MSERYEYIGVLRCQTWNTWAPVFGAENRDVVFDDGGIARPARLIVVSYPERTTAALYLEEKVPRGPLLWDGTTQGLHQIRGLACKAPEDIVEVAFQRRQAHRGEVDISPNFTLDKPISADVVESVRAIVFSAMTVLNLQLEDHLVPTLPFQMARVLGKNKLEFEDTIWLGAYNRSTLTVEQVSPVLGQIAKLLGTPRVGPKLLVALELYAAHLIEQQPRVRFLLLVIALEACADVELKHDAALDMLDRWKAEITTRLLECDADSDEYHSLQALAQQLFHRRQESIGNQIRKIFANLGKPEAEAKKLQRRAMALYGKRSDLVHKGYLPYAELSALEGEARELLEMIFHHALESSRQR